MILSCGDALFDVFTSPGASNASIAMEARVGGSPLNVAVALRRLGQKSAFFNRISTDPFGNKLMAYLAVEGVDTSLVVRTNAPTTLAIVALDDNRMPAYSFYIDGTADRSLELRELPPALSDAIKAIHIGSYATALEPTASSLEALVVREKGRRFIAYDPNIRPSTLPDRAVWRARVDALTAYAHLVKVSAEDLAFLYPGRATLSVLTEWVERGVALAVGTLGAEGAIAISRSGGSARVAAPKVDVVDTVGAGDSFQAALLTWLVEHARMTPERAAGLATRDLERLLAFAAGVAALTCSRRGANMPHRREVA